MRLEIIDKLELLEEYITILKELQQYSLEEIEKNYVLRGAVEIFAGITGKYAWYWRNYYFKGENKTSCKL
jgi:hypothetical protein